MKRRLLMFVLFLLLGAVVNVAVAWGCALFVDVATGDRDFVDERDFSKPYGGFMGSRWRRLSAHRVSLVYYSDREGTAGRQTMEMEELFPPWGMRSLLDEFPLKSGDLGDFSFSFDLRTIDGRGWPCLSLWGGLIDPNPLMRTTPTSSLRTHFAVLLDHPKPVRTHPASALVLLPLRPIWPGFAVNTVFYSAILWLLIPGPFALRRHIRRKRGLCVACGYDLRGNLSAGCPECGWRRDGAS